MIFLVFSIICSAAIFAVFKLFPRFHIHNLSAVVFNYFTAFTLGFSQYFLSSPSHDIEFSFLPKAMMLGVLFITLFVMMVMSTQKNGAGTTSAVVKMSIVIPVISGIWLYKDAFSWVHAGGLTLALVSIYLLVSETKGTRSKWNVILFLLFIGSGILDTLLKYAETYWIKPNPVELFSAFIFLSAGILGFGYLIYSKNIKHLKWKDVAFGVILGIPNYGSIYFLIKALETVSLPSARIFPINNIGIVLLSLAVGIAFFRERLSGIQWLGIIGSIISILLISYEG
jgi:drug/metabolite transporter (DMT)-like permease